MDATTANAALRTALTLIQMREPIPLHWAFEYSDRIPELWASVTEPEILFDVFGEMGGLLDRRIMVLALTRMLRSMPSRNDRPVFRALEAAEAWARDEITLELAYKENQGGFARREWLMRNLYRQPPTVAFVREKYLFAEAVMQIGNIIYRPGETGEQFRMALRAAAHANAPGSFGETAPILREYLPEPTLAMLLEATAQS